LQGESVKDWFSEQLHLALPDAEINAGPHPEELASLDDLDNEGEVIEGLKSVDWAFQDADTGYLTHDIHPYPAKFIPQIPAALLARLSMPGELVLDPFGGSGTTATEAVRLRRQAISIDANPLAAVIGEVKSGHLGPEARRELDVLSAAIESHVIAASCGTRKSQSKSTTQRRWAPEIPNLSKWFVETVVAELSLIRHLIDAQTHGFAQSVAMVALSRIVVRVSNQDSETRYVARQKVIQPGFTLRAFLEALRNIRRKLEHSAKSMSHGQAELCVGDSRTEILNFVRPDSVALVVSSPPYPNATDYHLYHRFRMFWLGFDPRALGPVEIGSHLKHQREGNGFEAYCADMEPALRSCFEALQPARYAVFVVGDAVYKGETFSTAEALSEIGESIGFRALEIIERNIHNTRRSFAHPARRARTEALVVLRKPDRSITVSLKPPTYRMWPYERELRALETQAICGGSLPSPQQASRPYTAILSGLGLARAVSRLTFTSEIRTARLYRKRTWQKVLENGDNDEPARKEPKYATHGLHAYKGKFYPQLAKALINVGAAPNRAKILDPFCGSGTVPLECYLNGYLGYGVDMHPLAAKIAQAKTSILSVDQSLCQRAVMGMLALTEHPPENVPKSGSEFPAGVLDELARWFPEPVLWKLNWLLSQIRLFGHRPLVDFLEVVVSSIVREISQQEPRDLRVRRRATPISDAPVLELFHATLLHQYEKLVHHWSIQARMPWTPAAPAIAEGDCRTLDAFSRIGLQEGEVDLVVTSPPYATALPYIDTDRLSLLAVMGINRRERSGIEKALTGSRELTQTARKALEAELLGSKATSVLPASVVQDIREIYCLNSTHSVGFRKRNMAALLWRYFVDMKCNLQAVRRLLKDGGTAFYVVGDSRTEAGASWRTIQTCNHLCAIARETGFDAKPLIDITVTRDNYKHTKNAITENKVLMFQKW